MSWAFEASMQQAALGSEWGLICLVSIGQCIAGARTRENHSTTCWGCLVCVQVSAGYATCHFSIAMAQVFCCLPARVAQHSLLRRMGLLRLCLRNHEFLDVISAVIAGTFI